MAGGGKRLLRTRTRQGSQSSCPFPVLPCARSGSKRVPGVLQQLGRSFYSSSKMTRLATISSCFWPAWQTIETRYCFRLVCQSVCATVVARSFILPQLPQDPSRSRRGSCSSAWRSGPPRTLPSACCVVSASVARRRASVRACFTESGVSAQLRPRLLKVLKKNLKNLKKNPHNSIP